MNKIYTSFNNFFSSRYANTKSLDRNIVILILYKLAYPTSRMFASFAIKPNTITLVSVAITGMAFVSLINGSSNLVFVAWWLLAVHLDFCDGTVARMTKTVSKSALRLDHLTDIFKIFLIFLGVAIRYDNPDTWILSSTAVFGLMFFEILNHELKFYAKKAETSDTAAGNQSIIESGWMKKTGLLRFPALINLLRNANTFLLTINAHTLLFFCIFPFGVIYANVFLIYFTVLTVYGITRAIITLRGMKR